ncbi:putative alpha-L-rhamnosidase [Corynespora cassiicola Philippines]|uniref:alpha-L-rhamnosidase n=1 Tax=Corynespora cassiicola Philippines TaxID=1448308 RepID=A0A2T2NC73_CORCC|nr:putative alpha-L-rhamnosidase [Corynespora cassiicola Philippines]
MRFSSVLATAALAVVPTLAITHNSTVEVVQLTVDGRFDQPLDLENTRPTLAWQIHQTNDCFESICPGDRQTAYEVQAAASSEDLQTGKLQWESGKVEGRAQQVRFDGQLGSRDAIAWRVRVWDANGAPSAWSEISSWSMGLLDQSDWGEARWIDYPDRNENQSLPIFARRFEIPEGKEVSKAYLYLSGVGMHYATVNSEAITDEVLAPGYSNYQLSSEYRTYDIKQQLRSGANVVGVKLGNGPAYVRRSVTNPAVGRNAPYSWWQSQLKGNGSLVNDVQAGSTSVQLNNVENYHLGGSINIDTGNGGDKLESRVITTIDNSTNTISFTPGLTLEHTAGARVTGSGNNIAASDASAGAAVTPRLIGRLEITYSDGSTNTIVTDRSWHTALGPLVTDNWYSGADYDARREIADWDGPNVQLNSSNWIAAGNAPPPNLATRLVARAAEVIRVQEHFTPISVTNPANGTWVFDFGQNMAGWPLLKLPQMPAGITIRMTGAESLNADGTVNQTSIGIGNRGTDVFNTYTTAGHAGGETWHPEFNYFAMQWVQVTGLPAGFTPSPDLITAVRVQGDVPVAGTFTSSNARVNRIHKMSRYSFMSNTMSVLTDCPGREKLSYPADYTMPIGAIYRNVHLHAFLRTTMHHLVEGQSIANTSMAGNVALKTPVYDWGYTGRFGDEINWGNAIVLVPALMYDLYGDTSVMETYYEQMTDFVDYIQREKVEGHIVNAALADWVEDDDRTSGRITGTWGYYHTISAMARMANLTGRAEDADRYASLALEIRDAFNNAFWNNATGRYTNFGNNSTANATQAAQALALDAGFVPEDRREQVLDALVELTYSYPSSDGQGPHLSGGTIGMGPIVRALSAGGRDDVLWEALQQNDRPSYGYFLAPTVENPQGFTTIGERWTRGSSKNHMILAQIDEWFHAAIAGIQPTALTTISDIWENKLIFEPKVIGDIDSAAGTYLTPWGEARSSWNVSAADVFSLTVTVPANIEAEVRLPAGSNVQASERARVSGAGNSTAIYTVPSGTHTFSTTLHASNGTYSTESYRRSVIFFI